VLDEVGSRSFMPSLFARRRESSAAAVSKVLRTLLDAGLVAAEIGAEDGRRRRYRVTNAGARVLETVEASRRRAIDAVWKDLDPADLRGFARFSDRLAERLEAYAGTAGAAAIERPARERPATERSGPRHPAAMTAPVKRSARRGSARITRR
jgi:DNA-binding MarR family transcriptional regulator